MKDIWKKFSGDFDSLTDDQIEEICQEDQNLINEKTEWLEAVASWKAAGKPRTKE